MFSSIGMKKRRQDTASALCSSICLVLISFIGFFSLRGAEERGDENQQREMGSLSAGLSLGSAASERSLIIAK